MDPYTEDVMKALAEEGESIPTGVVEAVRVGGKGIGCTPKKRIAFRSNIEPNSSASDRPLFNVDVPAYMEENYKSEKYEHRVIGFLKAQGHSNREIASITGYSPAAIGQIVRLPWVMELILEEIRRAGREEVEAVLQSAVLDSINVMLDIRDNEKNKTSDRLKAANDLLNRALGMPNQPITHKKDEVTEKMSDQELEKIASGGGRN